MPNKKGRTVEHENRTKTVTKNRRNKQVVKKKTIIKESAPIRSYKQDGDSIILKPGVYENKVRKTKTVKKKNPVTGEITKSTTNKSRPISYSAANRKSRTSFRKEVRGASDYDYDDMKSGGVVGKINKTWTRRNKNYK